MSLKGGAHRGSHATITLRLICCPTHAAAICMAAAAVSPLWPLPKDPEAGRHRGWSGGSRGARYHATRYEQDQDRRGHAQDARPPRTDRGG